MVLGYGKGERIARETNLFKYTQGAYWIRQGGHLYHLDAKHDGNERYRTVECGQLLHEYILLPYDAL